MAENTKFHSTLVVTNIKHHIPITLDMETSQYHSWATLFKVQAKVHFVLKHIIPPTESATITTYQTTKAANLPLWNRLDVVVLQWIYATISPNILTSILVANDSVANAWQHVTDLFQDNKNSRAVYLET
ncbi:uncharacterized protein LOC114180655 [Vigna unguiculata]|uniref:uncharacterized protein LOC114180655 n=1 Tax=Vigna unguiculata TaxID=3917 RepID=UPI0010161E98|nr:uncharacterized protein LOC114180655 [Vigna unguiculata]